MGNKPYVDDVGTVILVDCAGDLTDATICKLIIKKPDDDISFEWLSTIHQEPKETYLSEVDPDGKIYNRAARNALPDPLRRRLKYVVDAGDFDQAGYYEGNAYVESPAWRGRGESFRFRVYAHFEKG